MPTPRVNFRLDAATKADVRQALLLLDGSGLTLTEAARLALVTGGGEKIDVRRMPVEEAVRGFIADRHRRQRRGATLEYYETQLAKFVASPLAERWQQAARPALKKWLEGLPLGFSSRAMVFRSVHSLYRWAARQDPPLVRQVPTDGLELDDMGGDKKKVLHYPVEVCEGALGLVHEQALVALTLHLFAGIRPEEIAPRSPTKARLAWESIDVQARRIRVEAAVAKTRRARLVEELPTPLWEWLREVPLERRQGPVWALSHEHWRGRMTECLGGYPRIADGWRHTFATMALNFCKNAGDVAEWIGHEGKLTTLRNKYVGIELRANAAVFMRLVPAALRLERAGLVGLLRAKAAAPRGRKKAPAR